MALTKKKKTALLVLLGVYVVFAATFAVANNIGYKAVADPDNRRLAETRKHDMVQKFKEKEKAVGQFKELTGEQIDEIYRIVFLAAPDDPGQEKSLKETRIGMIRDVFGRHGFLTEEHVKEVYNILYGPKTEDPNREERMAAIRDMFASNEAALATKLTPEKEAELYDAIYSPKLGPIALNFTMVMQIVNFAALLIALYVFLWEPLTKFLDERRKSIQDDIASAKQKDADAEKTLQEYRQKMRDARDEAAHLFEEGRRRGEEKEHEILEEARREADRVRERTQASLRGEAEAARRALRREVAEFSVGIAGKILSREVREEDHHAFIEEALQGLESEDVKF